MLETARPAKFLDVMEAGLCQGCVEIHERLAVLADREKVAIPMGMGQSAFLDWLLARQ